MSDEGSLQQSEAEDTGKEPTKIDNSNDNDTNDRDPSLRESAKVNASQGPLILETLIEYLPNDCSPTSFDAHDKNLYLGTQQGDLLHYFEMETKNYMLVSQTKFDPEHCEPIEAIRVLALIEIALVHTGGALHFFLLPEFAPVPNMGSIPNVCDFQVIRYSSSSNAYQIQVFGSEGAKKVTVFNKRIVTSDLVFSKPISRAKVYRKSMMASNGSNYELTDLKTKETVPLFHVSETGADLKPLVAIFNTDEFLVCCGNSMEDSAMGLVVNCQGDITQGTLVFEKYPLDVLIDLPLILVDYGEHGVYVYQLEMNNEPKIVQKFWSTSHDGRLRLAKTSNIFSVDKPERKQQVVEKLRSVPLTPGTHEFRINEERAYVENNYEENTSSLLYSSAGIYLLSKEPVILQVNDYDEPTIEKINRILEHYRGLNYLGSHLKLEMHYLRLLQLFLMTLHCPSIDRSIVMEWCTSAVDVDLRIFLNLCDIEVFGDVWVPNGLIKFISETRGLKLSNKFTNFAEQLETIRVELRDDKLVSIKDRENVSRSVDIAIVKYYVDHGLSVDLDQCEATSYLDILVLLKGKEEQYSRLMYDIYFRVGDYPSCLSLLKEGKNGPQISSFILENLTNLQKSQGYDDQRLLEDIVFLIETAANVLEREPMMKDITDILSRSKLGVKDLISVPEKNVTKMAILEALGSNDVNDKHFMIEYYVSRLREVLERDNLWEFLGALSASYAQDLDYLKPSLKTFLDLKLNTSPECSDLLHYGEKLRALMYADDDRLVFDAVVEKIKLFDIANMLLFFLVKDEDKHLIFEQDLLDKLMTYNDFETIDKLVTEKDVIKVLKFYLQLESKNDSFMLLKNHLGKHLNSMTSLEGLIEVLKLIPHDFGLADIVDSLALVLVKIKTMITNQELTKALLKQKIYKDVELLAQLEGKGNLRN
ncbi:LAFA_0F03598g1_1 [Lachancea sp. 'fantastica']|nr:LAFA_0F03598g1_1 [Lachancea sp. 'fantastica']